MTARSLACSTSKHKPLHPLPSHLLAFFARSEDLQSSFQAKQKDIELEARLCTNRAMKPWALGLGVWSFSCGSYLCLGTVDLAVSSILTMLVVTTRLAIVPIVILVMVEISLW